MQPNGTNSSVVSSDGSPRSTVNTTIQAPRRKFVDEGKLRKVTEFCAAIVINMWSLYVVATYKPLNRLVSLYLCLHVQLSIGFY